MISATLKDLAPKERIGIAPLISVPVPVGCTTTVVEEVTVSITTTVEVDGATVLDGAGVLINEDEVRVEELDVGRGVAELLGPTVMANVGLTLPESPIITVKENLMTRAKTRSL